MCDEISDTTLVLVRQRRFLPDSFVPEIDPKSRVQKRHHLKAVCERLCSELDRFEDAGIRREGEDGSGSVIGSEPDDLDGSLRLTTVGEHLAMTFSIAVDLEFDERRQRVHHRHTDSVESARDLVPATAELAASMQDGEHNLSGRLVRKFGVRSDRNASAVVDHSAAPIGKNRHLDDITMPCHCFIDCVVDDLIDHVMQPGGTGGSDVHTRALAHCFQSFEDLDVTGGVVARCVRHR